MYVCIYIYSSHHHTMIPWWTHESSCCWGFGFLSVNHETLPTPLSIVTFRLPLVAWGVVAIWPWMSHPATNFVPRVVKKYANEILTHGKRWGWSGIFHLFISISISISISIYVYIYNIWSSFNPRVLGMNQIQPHWMVKLLNGHTCGSIC